MKLSKFLKVTLLATVFSILYVYQQTEVVRLAYAGQKRHALYQDMLDKNTVLRYNINKSASLVSLGKKLSGSSGDYEMPNSYRLVRVAMPKEGLNTVVQSLNRETFLSKVFGAKRQAEARTINP